AKQAKKYAVNFSETRTPHENRDRPGGPETFVAYGRSWANVSNTPFRLYKHWVHEGGIATPLIIHWPNGVKPGLENGLIRQPAHLIDIMATAVDAAETTYPEEYKGNQIAPLAGVSLLPLLRGGEFQR